VMVLIMAPVDKASFYGAGVSNSLGTLVALFLLVVCVDAVLAFMRGCWAALAGRAPWRDGGRIPVQWGIWS
jgi:hypothetical protein